MLIMPLKVWKDFQEDSTNKMTPEEYVELINNALTLRYGVGLLHVGDREGKSWSDEFLSTRILEITNTSHVLCDHFV